MPVIASAVLAVLAFDHLPVQAVPLGPAPTPPRIVSIAEVVPYPVDALLKRQEGRTTVEVTLDAQGNVRRCVVKVSSGSPSLDEATCETVRRWRFAPALDAAGNGVATTIDKSVLWRLPTSIPEPRASPVSSGNRR